MNYAARRAGATLILTTLLSCAVCATPAFARAPSSFFATTSTPTSRTALSTASTGQYADPYTSSGHLTTTQTRELLAFAVLLGMLGVLLAEFELMARWALRIVHSFARTPRLRRDVRPAHSIKSTYLR